MSGGWLRRIVSVVVPMIIVVVEQTQEHHGEEHKEKSLQKSYKQFEEVKYEACGGTNNRASLWASHALKRSHSKPKRAAMTV